MGIIRRLAGSIQAHVYTNACMNTYILNIRACAYCVCYSYRCICIYHRLWACCFWLGVGGVGRGGGVMAAVAVVVLGALG